MRGNIIQLPQNGEPGKIRFKPTKQDFPFNWRDVKGDYDSLKEGCEVDFNQGYQSGKPWAEKIRPIGGAKKESQKPEKQKEQKKSPPTQSPKEPPSPSQSLPVSQQPSQSIQRQNTTSQAKTGFPAPSEAQPEPPNGFVNPYNFVPLFGKVPRKPPESHELWKGRSGQISCKMTLKTPFFFPDTERRCKNAEGHERLYLLRDAENRAIIPGSELKGAFSAVAEAFANGCLRVFDDTMHFGYRPPPNEFLNPKRKQKAWEAGIVKALPTSEQPGKIALCQVAKVRFNEPLKKRRCFDDVKDARNGEQLHLRVREGRVTWATRQGTPDENPEGYMKITDVADVKSYKARKKSQRWFYNEDPEDKWFGFTKAVEQNYNAIHAIGFQRDARDTSFQVNRSVNGETVRHKWALPEENPNNGIGGLRPRRKPLSVGDLVYCVLRAPFDEMEDDERKTDAVKMLLAAEVGRVRYQHGVADRLPDEFAPCKDDDKLCPVCRLWGWIPPGEEEQKDEEEKNRQGFVRFSTARTVSELKETDVEANVTLSPLGQPHASAMSFYLQSPNNPREVGTYGKQNEPSREFALRGRKFYWHQEPRGQWRDTRDNGQPKQDSQNKTVELLQEGVTFTFTVEFDNLSDEDLGLLLLTLQPNRLGEENTPSQQFYHHLGMGKPLGLGSAEVMIDKLTLINRATRYQNLTATGKTTYDQAQMDSEEVQKFISAFTGNHQGNFAKRKHIEALLLMLDWEHKPEGVRYPPGPSDKSEESFRWFMDVNERLLTPREIADGKRQKPYP